MDGEQPKNVRSRLQRVEDQVEKIPEIQESLKRIEQELIGDPFGSRSTFKSRLQKLEEEHPDIVDRLEDVEDDLSRSLKMSTGGAGIVTILLNALKAFFM